MIQKCIVVSVPPQEGLVTVDNVDQFLDRLQPFTDVLRTLAEHTPGLVFDEFGLGDEESDIRFYADESVDLSPRSPFLHAVIAVAGVLDLEGVHITVSDATEEVQ